MKKYLIVFLLSCFIFSCNNSFKEEIEVRDINELKKGVVKNIEVSPGVEEALELSNIDLIGKREFKSELDSMYGNGIASSQRYIIYVAVVSEFNEPEGKENIERTTNSKFKNRKKELIYFNSISGCFIMNCFEGNIENCVARNSQSIHLLNDRKMPMYLKNDSIYLSTNGREYWTLPVEGRLAGHTLWQEKKQKYIVKGRPCELFSGYIEPKESNPLKEEEKIHYQIGYLSYECEKKYDWSAFAKSEPFKSVAAYGDHILERHPSYLNLSSFIIE